MSKNKNITMQQAFEVGKRGGAVNTNDMSWQELSGLDKASG